MSYSTGSFPEQMISLSRKDEEWKEACVDAIISREDVSYTNKRTRKEVMEINYDLYNGVFNEEDFKHVTNPYKVDEGFPASPHNLNIIRPKIDLLKGEETKRPLNIKVAKTSEEAASDLQDKTKEELLKYVMEEIMNQMQGRESEKDLDEVLKYVTRKYYSAEEKQAYNTLKYLTEKLNLRHIFYRGWHDALVAGEEIYYIGSRNGEPILERTNPVTFSYDTNPDIEFIEDGDWCLYKTEMSPASIYDRFFDIMDEEDLDDILKMQGSTVSGGNRIERVSNKAMSWKSVNSNANTNYDENLIDVYHACWKSFAKVGFLNVVDELGNESIEMVDETYKADPNEDIEWEWIVEVWEGYRIGEDKYIGIRPLPNQLITSEDPYGSKLPYFGVAYSNTNSKSKSLVDIMKPLQYIYIILWYRLELAIARDKGRVLTVDITQIPKSMNITPEKWMHYISALGVNFVNPYEEGWNIPGREGGKPAQFNQMSSQDLTMANVIGEYVQLLDKVEQMVGELSGVSKQRQGAISTNELVGNVERSVIQSSHITEPLFWMHSQVKKRAMSYLLEVAKTSWRHSNKTKLHYIFDDATRVFMNITDDFLNSDFDIFVTDSTKESQNIESLRTLLQPAMQNGASLLEMAEILTLDNMSAIKEKLEEVEINRQEREQAMQQQEQETQIQIQQMTSQDKADENRIKEEDSIRKAETQLEVARIQADSTYDSNDLKSQLESRKLELQKEKQEDDFKISKNKLEEDKRSNKVDEQQKEKELSIKKMAANKKPSTSTTK